MPAAAPSLISNTSTDNADNKPVLTEAGLLDLLKGDMLAQIAKMLSSAAAASSSSSASAVAAASSLTGDGSASGAAAASVAGADVHPLPSSVQDATSALASSSASLVAPSAGAALGPPAHVYHQQQLDQQQKGHNAHRPGSRSSRASASAASSVYVPPMSARQRQRSVSRSSARSVSVGRRSRGVSPLDSAVLGVQSLVIEAERLRSIVSELKRTVASYESTLSQARGGGGSSARINNQPMTQLDIALVAAKIQLAEAHKRHAAISRQIETVRRTAAGGSTPAPSASTASWMEIFASVAAAGVPSSSSASSSSGVDHQASAASGSTVQLSMPPPPASSSRPLAAAASVASPVAAPPVGRRLDVSDLALDVDAVVMASMSQRHQHVLPSSAPPAASAVAASADEASDAWRSSTFTHRSLASRFRAATPPVAAITPRRRHADRAPGQGAFPVPSATPSNYYSSISNNANSGVRAPASTPATAARPVRSVSRASLATPTPGTPAATSSRHTTSRGAATTSRTAAATGRASSSMRAANLVTITIPAAAAAAGGAGAPTAPVAFASPSSLSGSRWRSPKTAPRAHSPIRDELPSVLHAHAAAGAGAAGPAPSPSGCKAPECGNTTHDHSYAAQFERNNNGTSSGGGAAGPHVHALMPSYMRPTFTYGLKDIRVDVEGVRAVAEMDRCGSAVPVPPAQPPRPGVKKDMVLAVSP